MFKLKIFKRMLCVTGCTCCLFGMSLFGIIFLSKDEREIMMNLEQCLKKNKIPSKHQLLKYFIEVAGHDLICNYYFDENLKRFLAKFSMTEYLNELKADGYIRKMHRYIKLTGKGYSYPHEYRMQLFDKILSVLRRPVSYLLSWALGILSSLIVQHLINVLNLKP